MAQHNILKKGNNILVVDNPNKEYEKLKLYSKEEIIIGKWFDGKKLYRKIVDFGSFPSNGQRTVNHNILNLSEICWFNYSWYDTADNKYFNGPRIDSSGIICKLAINYTSLIIEGLGNVAWADRTTGGKCIIYYTKITD